jgi:uncharacterized peroxidase-related enzyme
LRHRAVALRRSGAGFGQGINDPMNQWENRMAWIKTIEPGDASGDLKAQYDAAVERAGRVFNVVKIQSLNPQTLRASMELYLATMKAPSGLSRAEREMLATVVSWANHCFY